MFNFNLTRSTQNKIEKKGGKIKKRRKRGQSFVSGLVDTAEEAEANTKIVAPTKKWACITIASTRLYWQVNMIFATHILTAALAIPLASAFVPSTHHVPSTSTSSSVTRASALCSTTSAVNNVVLSPSDEAENFDSYAIGTPRVHRYLRDDGSDDAQYGELFFQIFMSSSIFLHCPSATRLLSNVLTIFIHCSIAWHSLSLG